MPENMVEELAPAPPAPADEPAPVPADTLPRLRPRWAIGLFLGTLIAYALFTPQVLYYTNPPTGDQPYYLHTAISIVQDGDIEESNNYAQEDERLFYPRVIYPWNFPGILAPYPLPPHAGNTTARPGYESYSKHGLGLSVLVVPGWALGMRLPPPGVDLQALDQPTGGWPMVVYEMNILGALLAVQIFLLAYEATGRRGLALVVWAAMVFSNPQMTYSYLIFPELPAGLCVIYAFRRLMRGLAANGPWRLGLVGICVGFLPWLHARFLPLVLALGLYAAWQWVREYRTMPYVRGTHRLLTWTPVLGPVILSAVLLAGYYYWLYGTPLPNAGDHAGFINPLEDPWGFPIAALGLLFDQQWGLLVAAPIYLLAFVGLFTLWQEQAWRPAFAWLLIVVVPYALLVADYRQWWGEWCPPARYLATITPLLALPLAHSLRALGRRRVYQAIFGLLALVGWAVMGGMFADPHAMWNQPTGQSALLLDLKAETEISLLRWVPTVVPWTRYHLIRSYELDWPLLGLWASVAMMIVLGCLLLATGPPAPPPRPRRWGLRRVASGE